MTEKACGPNYWIDVLVGGTDYSARNVEERRGASKRQMLRTVLALLGDFQVVVESIE